MLRLAVRRAVARAIRNPEPVISCPSPLRLFATNTAAAKSQPERTAAEMIRYALIDARTRSSSGDWREDSLRILEQGVSNLEHGGEGSVEAIGMLMLAMSTLHYERGKYNDAVEKLEGLKQLNPSPPFRVANTEALMGIIMETSPDFAPDDPLISLDDTDVNLTKFRFKGINGLGALINGDIESAKNIFDVCRDQDYNAPTDQHQLGNMLLSYGEYLHSTGNFKLAKGIYEKCIEEFNNKHINREYIIAGTNMVPEETYIASICALGQLLSHTGKIDEAEELLTKALTKAEAHFGSNHPKVGVVLMCIVKMFKEKAKLEGSSSIIVQEGLYRRALQLLKAPELNSEVNDVPVERRDIISLAIGGYAELLLIQKNRREEGERMKNWAENNWKNKRLSLNEALDFSQSSNISLVDTRVCKII